MYLIALICHVKLEVETHSENHPVAFVLSCAFLPARSQVLHFQRDNVAVVVSPSCAYQATDVASNDCVTVAARPLTIKRRTLNMCSISSPQTVGRGA